MAMTTVKIQSYDDLRGDQILHSRGKDAVLDELKNGADAVLWLDDWLVDEKSLEPIARNVAGLTQLFIVRKIAETEKAWLVTQSTEGDPDADEPGTDWVPRSAARLYVRTGDPGDVEDSTPQYGLDKWADAT